MCICLDKINVHVGRYVTFFLSLHIGRCVVFFSFPATFRDRLCVTWMHVVCFMNAPDPSVPSSSRKLGFSCQGQCILHVRKNPGGVNTPWLAKVKAPGPHSCLI